MSASQSLSATPSPRGAALFGETAHRSCLPLQRRQCLRCKEGEDGRHGVSSPIATLDSGADRRAKADGVPRWGCLSRARPVTPTRCVQRLGSAVEYAATLAMADPSRGRIALPPSRRRHCLRRRGRRGRGTRGSKSFRYLRGPRGGGGAKPARQRLVPRTAPRTRANRARTSAWVRSLLFAALALLLLAGAWAPAHAVEPGEMLKDPALEARARHISQELRCLVCQNQSIDDSNAELARDLRLLVRERLAAGDSDATVLAFVEARYGEFALLRPRLQVAHARALADPAAAPRRRRHRAGPPRPPAPVADRRGARRGPALTRRAAAPRRTAEAGPALSFRQRTTSATVIPGLCRRDPICQLAPAFADGRIR